MSKEMLFLCDVYDKWLDENELPHRSACDILYGENACKLTGNQTYWLESFIATWDVIAEHCQMIDKLTVTVPFNGDELYEIIKLYDILRDMDFELSETQVEVFEKLQDAEVNGGFF